MVQRIILVVCLSSLLFVLPAKAHQEEGLSESATCSKYRCKTDDEKFTENTCIAYDLSEDIHLLDPCSKGYTCTQTIGTNSTCIKETPSTAADKYPGEKCTDNTDCVYGACSDKKCVGYTAGTACVSTLQCEPGLYCDTATTTCTPLKNDGALCTHTDECGMHSYCQTQTSLKVCAAYFSVKNNTAIDSCNLIAYECETMACYEDENKNGYCFEAVESGDDLPIACTSNSDCESSYSGMSITSECECGYNQDGTSYCGLHPGDEAYQKLLKYYKNWLKGSDIEGCNSARRFESLCMKDMLDEEDYWDLTYYYIYATQYPKTRNNDDCLKTIYNSKFYEADDEREDDDNALALGCALIAGLIVMI